MVWVVGSGSRSRSESSMTTYSSLATSQPRLTSFQGTSLSSSGHQRRFLMGWPSLGQSRRKETLFDSVARYIRTGIATIPKLMAPRHMERGMRPSIGASGSERRLQMPRSGPVSSCHIRPEHPLGEVAPRARSYAAGSRAS